MGLRRTYTLDERRAALRVVREIGTKEASRQLGISVHTLRDWKACAQACAHSAYVGTVRKVGPDERTVLLDQLAHEQEIESHFERRTYRHNSRRVGSKVRRMFQSGDGDKLPGRDALESAVCEFGDYARALQPHMIPWADPTFEEVWRELRDAA